jgi:bifunctional UDP-N-acetylglucosamine pyrophosphorylase / glucosamine-1-phosphate N-acetyltransferase
MDNEILKSLSSKGVIIIEPQTVFISDDVDPDNIERGVTIYPGCRISGRKTFIGKDTKLGQEAPVTIEGCATGCGVELKGGYFKNAVFLDRSLMGSGAHVREATIVEEEANAAHTVGLKQTILFPFVTLGSLINFCDCMMAGGTSRKNHSEVGSSYIHFNFTPNMDKATASLMGDVPRGVFLRERPIFLGGQGGLVGPSRIGFGSTIAAGIVYRNDLADGMLVAGTQSKAKESSFIPGAYFEVKRKVMNNISYIANLIALRKWYTHVRSMFLSEPLLKASVEAIDSGLNERVSRLKAFAAKIPESVKGLRLLKNDHLSSVIREQEEFHLKWPEIEDQLNKFRNLEGDANLMRDFLSGLPKGGTDYIESIRSLDENTVKAGISWLSSITHAVETGAGSLLPTLS